MLSNYEEVKESDIIWGLFDGHYLNIYLVCKVILYYSQNIDCFLLQSYVAFEVHFIAIT